MGQVSLPVRGGGDTLKLNGCKIEKLPLDHIEYQNGIANAFYFKFNAKERKGKAFQAVFLGTDLYQDGGKPAINLQVFGTVFLVSQTGEVSQRPANTAGFRNGYQYIISLTEDFSNGGNIFDSSFSYNAQTDCFCIYAQYYEGPSAYLISLE